jgi:hypothetical protein
LSRGVDGPVADPVRADAPGVGVVGGDVPVGLVTGAVEAIATGPRCGTELHPSIPARSTAEESTRTTIAREG